MALTTTDLEILLNRDPILEFGGVKSYDEIPSKVEFYPRGYVINTHPGYKKGEHWISIHFDSYRRCQYFCSFGTVPFGKTYDFVKANSDSVNYNKNLVQSPFSSVCGYYSLYHLVLAARGYSLADVIKTFDIDDPVSNDSRVIDFTIAYLENSQ